MATDTQRRGDCVRGANGGKAAHDDPAQRAARPPPPPPPGMQDPGDAASWTTFLRNTETATFR